LVAGGVPVVLGMGGEVGDLTCRLFTGGFGQALLGGQSLLKAQAVARAAAFGQGAAPEETVDWAFPVTFLGEDVPADYQPVDPSLPNPQRIIETWIENYAIPTWPPFFDRFEFFEVFEELFKPGGGAVLVAAVTAAGSGYGKTRLLQELAIHALRDGHLPLLYIIQDKSEQAKETPKTNTDLARRLAEAIRNVRKYLDLPLGLGQLARLMQEPAVALADPTLDPAVADALRFGNDLTAEVVQLALQSDLAQLITDGRTKYPELIGPGSRVVVLLDDVDQYDQALSTLVAMLSQYGLGTDVEPVPVVMTGSLTGPEAQNLHSFLYQPQTWLQLSQLGPFEERTGEDQLASEWFLLNPLGPNTPILSQIPGITDTRWVITRSPDQALTIVARNLLTNTFKGIPGKLANAAEFYGIFAQTLVQSNYLIKADDEGVLAAWIKGNPWMPWP
jgi:hypothetical protein